MGAVRTRLITRSKRLRTWGSRILICRPRACMRVPNKKYPRLIFTETEMLWIKEAVRVSLPLNLRTMDEEYGKPLPPRHQSMLERVKRLEARRRAKHILSLAQKDQAETGQERSRAMDEETSGSSSRKPKKIKPEGVSIGQIAPKQSAPKKRKTKAEREEENYQFIQTYRTKMLAVANKEAMKMRRSLKLDKGEAKYSRISFNETKEILEFSSSIYPQKQKFSDLIESESQPVASQAQNLFSVKSAPKGSQEVMTGELPSRLSILGSKKTVNVMVPEFRSANATPSKSGRPR